MRNVTELLVLVHQFMRCFLAGTLWRSHYGATALYYTSVGHSEVIAVSSYVVWKFGSCTCESSVVCCLYYYHIYKCSTCTCDFIGGFACRQLGRHSRPMVIALILPSWYTIVRSLDNKLDQRSDLSHGDYKLCAVPILCAYKRTCFDSSLSHRSASTVSLLILLQFTETKCVE